MTKHWDVIVVGARCAGSPLAALLARQGYDVLVVDRATFPSDTVSTHCVHTPGVAALERWGVLDEVVATGCPPIPKYTLDFGPITISGSPAIDGTPNSYAPRRTVLDEILVRAAERAGAEVREGFRVEDVLIEDGRVVGIRGRTRDGANVTERARVVVGADGRHSLVAEAVKPEAYNTKPPLQGGYYAYFSGLPVDGFEIFVRPFRGFAAIPTNDDLTLIVGGWPAVEIEANKRDVQGNFDKMLQLAPSFYERVMDAKRETRWVGASVDNFFRKPYGPGWVLVGDAGYNKDPITAQGITDAFRDVELVATALDEVLTGARRFDDAMSDYQTTRDAHALPMYEFTTQLATLEPPPPEMQQLFGAIAASQQSMDGFVRVNAGATSPAEFFSEENIGAIMSRAGALQSA